jgi:hypothetical protein
MAITRDFSTWKAESRSLEHALFRRLGHRILGDADEPEGDQQQRPAVQNRIEFWPLAELELLDHLACEVARQNELHLARHRLLIDGGAAVGGFFRLWPHKKVVAGLDQDPRLRPVPRRHEGHRGSRKRERDDQAFLAPQGAGERSEIKFVDDLRNAKPTRRGFD